MNRKSINSIAHIIDRLQKKKASGINAFMGFDACVDSIVNIVSEKKDNEVTEFFNNSRQFGEFLVNLNNKSCGVELQTKLSKIGGNMVITGNALGKLGMKVECVGTFGLPDILPVFRTMSSNCTLHTIAETISATALEFNNSKVIMFDPGPYNNLTWNGIKNMLGTERIREMLSDKQLIAFVNWSEIENSSQIWKGILDEILPSIVHTGEKPVFFTDFSDCSRKSKKDIQFAVELLGRFRNYFRVVISLNQNEADLISKALGVSTSDSDEATVKSLLNSINVDLLTIHRVKDALAYDGKTFEMCDTFYCETPTVLTGGGDNFNAGFCFALFSDLDLYESLLLANAVSGSYVKTGISPDVNKLIDFLQ